MTLDPDRNSATALLNRWASYQFNIIPLDMFYVNIHVVLMNQYYNQFDCVFTNPTRMEQLSRTLYLRARKVTTRVAKRRILSGQFSTGS